jgi:hypothetical protein
MKLIIMVGLILCGLAVQAQDKRQVTGEVDSLTAVNLAQKAWLKKFGKQTVNKAKPYYARLYNDSIWEVKGTLHTDRGGTPYALVLRRTGRVLMATHTK